MSLTIGKLREQSALVEADRPVVLVTDDPQLPGLATWLEVVACYPDTDGTFKIKVRRKQA